MLDDGALYFATRTAIQCYGRPHCYNSIDRQHALPSRERLILNASVDRVGASATIRDCAYGGDARAKAKVCECWERMRHTIPAA